VATVQLELFWPEGFTAKCPDVTSNIEECLECGPVCDRSADVQGVVS
jgi:hypothetical protein